jgi:hypothetical protein
LNVSEHSAYIVILLQPIKYQTELEFIPSSTAHSSQSKIKR